MKGALCEARMQASCLRGRSCVLLRSTWAPLGPRSGTCTHDRATVVGLASAPSLPSPPPPFPRPPPLFGTQVLLGFGMGVARTVSRPGKDPLSVHGDHDPAAPPARPDL